MTSAIFARQHDYESQHQHQTWPQEYASSTCKHTMLISSNCTISDKDDGEHEVNVMGRNTDVLVVTAVATINHSESYENDHRHGVHLDRRLRT